MGKNIDTRKYAEAARRDKNWTILFIGSSGKIRSIKWFKGFITFTIFLLIITLSGAGGVYYLYDLARKENKVLKEELDSVRTDYFTIRDEKDRLMARIVLAESDLINDEFQDDFEPDPAIDPSYIEDGTVLEPVEIKGPDRVEVEDFRIVYDVGNKILRPQFKLKNIDTKAKPLSGRTFIIFKHNDEDQNTWYAIPSVAIIEGKPAEPGRGQYFSIYNFKTVKYRAYGQSNPTFFKTATVFIYNIKQELLKQQTFPVENNLRIIAPPPKPVSVPQPAEQTETEPAETPENPGTDSSESEEIERNM